MKNFRSNAEFLDEVRKFSENCLSPLTREIDKTDIIPEVVYSKLTERRLFAFNSLADGGEELSAPDRIDTMLRCLTIISETSPAIAKAVMDQNFGQIGMMRQFGNPTIQGKLENIRAGRKQAAFLMTEPQSGSELTQFETNFEYTMGGVMISGTKDWITGADRREYFVTLAKEAGTTKNFGLFLIDRGADSSGIKISDRKNKLGLRGLGEYRVELDRIFVPHEHTVIAPGSGVIAKIMAHYNIKRCGQAAISLGTIQAALRSAHSYLQTRFKGEIPFQNTQFVFADLYSRLSAIRPLPHSAAIETLAGDSSGVPASIAKYVCTELAVEATTKLAQLCGGNGLSDKLPLERQMRDMRMLTVAGGASQVLQTTIARNMERLLQKA